MLGELTANEELRARLEFASRLGALGADAHDFVELFGALYEETHLLSLGAIAAQAGSHIKRLHATEQMALEHERHALQLEAVLASMNDALLIVDARGAIVRLNRAARELLSLDGASLVFGQPLEPKRVEQWPDTAREIAEALVPAIDALRSGASHAGVEI